MGLLKHRLKKSRFLKQDKKINTALTKRIKGFFGMSSASNNGSDEEIGRKSMSPQSRGDFENMTAS